MIKKIYIFIIIIIVFLFSLFIYFFILPPMVINISQRVVNNNLAALPEVMITFDKPVERQNITPSITPDVSGEWQYQQPISGNHLFTSLVFIPEAKMDPSIQYEIQLGNIKSFFNIGNSSSYTFIFKPNADVVAAAANEKITMIDIKPGWQESKLSCEAASLKMALSSKGVNVSESAIMQKIGYDPAAHSGFVWGDPNKNFVGDINGKMCDTGYGVYWKPVALAASFWRPSKYFSGGDVQNIVKAIQAGNPIVVWGTLPVKNLTDCSWRTSSGAYVKAIKQDHVRLVIGFMGDAQNPTKIILNDPLSGRLYWDTDFFMNNWKAFDDSGVVVE